MNKKGETRDSINLDNNNLININPINKSNKPIKIVLILFGIASIILFFSLFYDYFSNKNELPSPITNNSDNIVYNDDNKDANITNINTTIITNQTTQKPSS
ncbi:MAG: hypothetical protein ACP5OG_02600, partial [Candidatus Nanoarchaeia archaeon]